MRSSIGTPRFPDAGWLGAKLMSWRSKKAKKAIVPRKPRASPEDLERLRQKFAKSGGN